MLPQSAKTRSELALFLKFLRRRVDGDVPDLGPHPRLPSRLGKRVTQEELAEAIGVSREWYGMLESAATTRPSPALVERLADALAATPPERARLFQLALPELGRVELRDDSVAVLEGFSRLRSLTKRLWAATSTEDVLATASEDIANWFDGAILIEGSRRRDSGIWESRAVDDQQERNDASSVIRELEHEVLPTSEAIDALNLYPRLENAGDTGTPELHPLPVQREVVKLYARRRLAGFTFIKGRLRTRTGLIGGFCIVHELGHSYSAADRAVLGAFAELSSLALS
ncbi:MAG: transcriptional regulator [Candidatus Eremiobacteraeota bacterium]|nr:transcriptional regulator [Candidatus Eremiobacteraeota bacterium]